MSVAALQQIDRWVQSAKDACNRKDHEAAWSACNQAQHVINREIREAMRATDTKGSAK